DGSAAYCVSAALLARPPEAVVQPSVRWRLDAAAVAVLRALALDVAAGVHVVPSAALVSAARRASADAVAASPPERASLPERLLASVGSDRGYPCFRHARAAHS